jgi:hypothetical protein
MEEDKPEEEKQEKENAEDIFLVSQIKYDNVMSWYRSYHTKHETFIQEKLVGENR